MKFQAVSCRRRRSKEQNMILLGWLNAALDGRLKVPQFLRSLASLICSFLNHTESMKEHQS